MTGHLSISRPGLMSVGALLALAVVASAGLQTGSAQTGTGIVTGRVVWGSVCFTPGPFPAVPGGAPEGIQPRESVPGAPPVESESATPDSSRPPVPGGIRPVPPRAFPAGAVLVAVQGSNVSARTDENGRFRLERVPAGQFLTVAAGPHAAAANAFALLPNIQVDAGQTRDLGTLSLGSSGPGPCRFAPGALGAPDSGEALPATP